MSNPCRSRGCRHRDYTETMGTEILERIRDDLYTNPPTGWNYKWGQARLARVKQILRDRKQP